MQKYWLRKHVTAPITGPLTRPEIRDLVRAEVELVSVFVDLETHRPMAFPEWIKDVFLKFDAKAENAPKLEEVPAE